MNYKLKMYLFLYLRSHFKYLVNEITLTDTKKTISAVKYFGFYFIEIRKQADGISEYFETSYLFKLKFVSSHFFGVFFFWCRLLSRIYIFFFFNLHMEHNNINERR